MRELHLNFSMFFNLLKQFNYHYDKLKNMFINVFGTFYLYKTSDMHINFDLKLKSPTHHTMGGINI